MHLLVQELKARLTHAHFLFNAKLWNGGVLGRTLSTENLTAGPTVVLEKQTAQIEVNFSTGAINMYTLL